VKAGVVLRVIGGLKDAGSALPGAKKSPIRLHTRTIIRDGSWAFVGSQSLRTLELDARREVGILFRDPQAVARLVKTFEEDWQGAQPAVRTVADEEAKEVEQIAAAKLAKKVAKAVAEELPPVQPVIELTVRELAEKAPGVDLNHREVEESVKQAVHDAVRQVVRDYVEEAVETQSAGGKVA
jgi:phosphatidylserine/phosphatidylglycerophosphate/cardiolipin synthase-like enzyme